MPQSDLTEDKAQQTAWMLHAKTEEEPGYLGFMAGWRAGAKFSLRTGYEKGVSAAWRAVALMISDGDLEVTEAQAMRISEVFGPLHRALQDAKS